MLRRPYVIAHRGISGRYPENTLLAYQKAIEARAEWIELDVHTSADDVVIISHDTQARRCTDGHGFFKHKTLAEIKKLDAGSWMDPKFAGLRVPTLEETLDFMGDGRIRICIEIKGDETSDYMRTTYETVRLLQKHNCLRYCMIASFNHEILRAVKEWEPLICTSLDPQPQDGSITPWELCQQVLGYDINAMQHKEDKLTLEIIDEAHKHGFSLWTWTVNEPDNMRRIVDMQPDGIMTDYADTLREIVDEMCPVGG